MTNYSFDHVPTQQRSKQSTIDTLIAESRSITIHIRNLISYWETSSEPDKFDRTEITSKFNFLANTINQLDSLLQSQPRAKRQRTEILIDQLNNEAHSIQISINACISRAEKAREQKIRIELLQGPSENNIRRRNIGSDMANFHFQKNVRRTNLQLTDITDHSSAVLDSLRNQNKKLAQSLERMEIGKSSLQFVNKLTKKMINFMKNNQQLSILGFLVIILLLIFLQMYIG